MMKKILFAFLFVLTATTAAFSAPGYFVNCEKINNRFDCTSVSDDTKKTHKVIKGTILENCSQIKLNPSQCPKLSNVKITFIPDDNTLAQQTIMPSNPSFAFFIKRGVDGYVLFQKNGYETALIKSENFSDNGRYIPLSATSENLKTFYVTGENNTRIQTVYATINRTSYHTNNLASWFRDLRIPNNSNVLISSDGYNAKLVTASELHDQITLKKSTVPVLSIRVTNQSGTPLPGATVSVNGKQYTATTDGWVLNIPAEPGTPATISNKGYNSRSIELQTRTGYEISQTNAGTSGSGTGSGNNNDYDAGSRPDKITATGRVYDANTKEPLPGAAIYPKKDNTKGTVTDNDGNFLLSFDKDLGNQLVVSLLGYNIKELTAGKSLEIALVPEKITLDAITVEDKDNCSNPDILTLQRLHATATKWLETDEDMPNHDSDTYNTTAKKRICIPTSCEDGYTLEEAETPNAECLKCDKSRFPFASRTRVSGNKCVLVDCVSDAFGVVGNACVLNCNHSSILSELSATKAELKTGAPTPGYTGNDFAKFCYPTACDETKSYLDGTGEKTTCSSNEGQSCIGPMREVEPEAKTAKFDGKGLCKLETCNDGYNPTNTFGNRACDGTIKGLKCSGKCEIDAGAPCTFDNGYPEHAKKVDGTKDKKGICVPVCWENYKAKLNGTVYECAFDKKTCPNRITNPDARKMEVTPDDKYWDVNTGDIATCKITECSDKTKVPDENGETCVEKCTKEAEDELKTNGHALDTTTDRNNGNCIISECQCGYTLNKGENKCQKWVTEVQTPSCTKRTNPVLPENAKKAHMDCDTTAPAAEQTYCSIDECDPLFEKQAEGNRQNAKCVAKSPDCTPENKDNTQGKGIWKVRSGVEVCEPICIGTNYEPDWDAQTKTYRGCVIKSNREGKRCPGDVLRNYPHASRGEVKTQDTNGNVTECTITDCDRGYNLDNQNNQCVYCACGTEWDATSKSCKTWATSCNPMPTGAKTAVRTCKDKSSGTDKTDCGEGTCTEYCKITACDTDAGYTLDEAKNECISGIGKPCTSDQLTAVDANATAGVLRKKGDKVVCVITECTGLYTPASDGSSCRSKPMLNEQQHREKIGELSENAQKMRENETSLKNRIIGAAGIGMTGIGGAMVGDALSSRAAELSAEQDMAAYLQSMYCEYGDGKTIRGGETGVELPGGNDMIDLYTQYAQLANDLKIRKDALGIRPGIESEVVIDKAETGLYDDVGTGITGGTYASIARALLYPDGPDAAKWAQMRAATDNKLKAGAIVAGVGAVGSGVANYIVNHDVKNNVDEILNRFTKTPHRITAVQNLDNDLNQVAVPTRECPSNITTGTYPNCICNDANKTFISENLTCESCPDTNQTVVDNICVCPSDMPWDEDKKACVEKEIPTEPQCTPTPGSHLHLNEDGKCTCVDGFSLEESICVCRSPKVEQSQSDAKVLCIDAPAPQQPSTNIIHNITTVTDNINLSSSALFDFDKATIRSDAQDSLNKFVSGLTSDQSISNCTIDLVGYTDPVGPAKHNLDLSQRRSVAVKEYLVSRGIVKALKNQNASSITTNGQGEANCKCYEDKLIEACKNKTSGTTLPDGVSYSPCRRVELTITCQKTTTSSQTIDVTNQVIQAAQSLTGISQQ